MSVNWKAVAQKYIDAASEKGIETVLPEVQQLIGGLVQIAIESAKKGETKLAKKAGTSDPMTHA